MSSHAHITTVVTNKYPTYTPTYTHIWFIHSSLHIHTYPTQTYVPMLTAYVSTSLYCDVIMVNGRL